MENKPIKSQSRLWAAVLIICAIAGVVGIGYGANFFLRTARQTGSTASYNRPLLSLDKDPDYDGAAYQNIRLGISLDELKGQMEATHHPLSTERRKLDDVTWAYDAADKLPLANIATWRPYFRFIEDKGVERLCEIGGLLPSDYDTRNKILEVLAKKYGSGSVPNDTMLYGCAWNVGSKHPTVVRIVPIPGLRVEDTLCFTDQGLLSLAEEQRKQQAPGL